MKGANLPEGGKTNGRNVSAARKKFAVAALKLGVTLGLFSWLLSRIELDAVSGILAGVRGVDILIAIGLHTVAILLGGLRWWLLLGHTGASGPFRSIFPSYYLGIFFNNILPTGVGGDVVRTLHLKLRGHSLKSLVSSAIVDRLIGLGMILMIGSAALLAWPGAHFDDNSRRLALALLLAVPLSAGLLFVPPLGAWLERLHGRYRHTRVRGALLDLIRMCYSYRAGKSLVLAAVAITVGMQSLVILCYYLLGNSVGIALPAIAYFAVVPVVLLAASLPISLGGLGVREGALVGLLLVMNVGSQPAIALSLLFLFVLWVSSAPGALVLLASQKNRPRR
jgi:uncharacterized protein (TIRG00374 family)